MPNQHGDFSNASKEKRNVSGNLAPCLSESEQCLSEDDCATEEQYNNLKYGWIYH